MLLFPGTRIARPLGLVVPLLVVLVFLGGCGQAGPGVGQVPPTSTESPLLTPTVTPSSGSPSPSQGPRLIYTDSEFGFKVDYPAHFKVKTYSDSLRESSDGFLRIVIFTDRQFEGGEGGAPAGVDIRVYEKDKSDALDEWVQRHSAPKSAPDSRTVYFRDTANLEAATVAGRQGVSFEWDANESGTVRARAFLYKTYVVAIEWSGVSSSYESTTASIFEQMVASWKDG